MNEVKSILASRTVWAGLLAAASGIAQVYGYEFGPDRAGWGIGADSLYDKGSAVWSGDWQARLTSARRE